MVDYSENLRGLTYIARGVCTYIMKEKHVSLGVLEVMTLIKRTNSVDTAIRVIYESIKEGRRLHDYSIDEIVNLNLKDLEELQIKE